MPEQVPTPAPSVLAQLPDQEVAAAVAVLASLIAKTASPTLVSAPIEEVGGE
jgi:hypothetical protein